MLKLTHTTKNAALAAVLTAGLAGTAAMTLMPVMAHAQDYDDYRYYRDRDDYYYRTHYYDHRYYRDYDDRGWVGVGVPGFGVGFYTGGPYYHRYCSDWDFDRGYCR